ASVGELAARYPAGVPLRGSAARLLQERTTAGPWVARERGPHGSRTRTDGPAALDLSFMPLNAGGGPIGVLIAGQAPGPGERPAAQMTRRLPLLEECASLVTGMLRPGLEAGSALAGARAACEAIIAKRAFVPHFQPIVRLADGSVVGHEALTRFTDGTRPDVRFAEAERLGLGHAMERATLESAMLAAGTLPQNAWLSLNVSPSLLVGDLLPAGFFAAARREIVLELTEHAPVADYDALRARIGSLRPPARVAVDDAGSGYASLRHVLALRPAFVKLDVAWVRGIEGDPARQALIAGLVHFAAELGCELIGEGIETEPEREMLLRLGVHHGQGYLLGRPAPARG
ncbi:MAG TPA: EAL domain-containing protein, partial [Candidatus Saccharimonadales bacterium]|nr:EAL domain-containing protein [Candidatus Saccharimonadales bacterium]